MKKFALLLTTIAAIFFTTEAYAQQKGQNIEPVPFQLVDEKPSFDEGWNNIVNVEVKPMFPNCTYCEYYKTCQSFYGARGCKHQQEIIKSILLERKNEEKAGSCKED